MLHWLNKQKPSLLNARFAVAAAIFLIPLVYFFPAVRGQVVLSPNDGWLQNYPLRVLLGNLLAQGELPLWNPFIFAGMPLLATTYPGAAYPPNWLFAVLPSGAAMNVVVIVTYHLALLGAYRLGRAWRWQRGAALCMALSFTFSAFMLNHLGQTSRIAAAAWLPWVIWVIERLAHRVTARWIALGALFVGLQMLAGEPQMWLYTALLAAVYAGWQISCGAGRERRRAFLLSFAAVYVIGLLLSAVQWIPAWELVRSGERASIGYEAFTEYALPARQWFSLWLPFFSGGASSAPYKMPYVYWGAWNQGIPANYVGMLAWLLALVALVPRKSSGETRSFVRLWAAVAVISLLLALGDDLPIITHLLFQVPGYNVFRGPYRHQFEFVFALSVLAGAGWQRLADEPLAVRRRWLKGATMVLVLVVLMSCAAYVWLTPLLFPRAIKTFLLDANVTIPLACLSGSLIAAYWYWGNPATPPRWASVVLLAWLAVDLAFYGHFFYWRDTPYPTEKTGADTAVTRRIKSLEQNAHDYRVVTHYKVPDQPDWAFDWELLNYPNVSLLRGLHNVNGYDVLLPDRFAKLTEQDGRGLFRRVLPFSAPHCGLDLLNTKYFIFSTRAAELGLPQGEPMSLPPERWRQIEQFGSVTLYENLRALPRAWLVAEARTLASSDVLQTIQTSVFPDGSAFDPRRTVIFSRKEIPSLPVGALNEPVSEAVSIQQYSANRIALQVATPQPRWLVLSEMAYPGWEALLDGQPTPSYRADYLLRTVAIPSGTHRIEFRYRPTSFLVGAWLSVLTLAVLVVILIRNGAINVTRKSFRTRLF